MKMCIFCMHQVGDDALACPRCREYKGIMDASPCKACGEPENDDYPCDCYEAKAQVNCKLCGADSPVATAHLHQGEWVGDCCWDERLRATE